MCKITDLLLTFFSVTQELVKFLHFGGSTFSSIISQALDFFVAEVFI